MLNWVIRKRVAKERKRQIKVLGYDLEHDIKATTEDENHLLDEASAQFERGNFIAALALLEADLKIVEVDRANALRTKYLAMRNQPQIQQLPATVQLQLDTTPAPVSAVADKDAS